MEDLRTTFRFVDGGFQYGGGGGGGPSESQRGKRPDEGGQRGKGPQGLQQPPRMSPAVGKQRPAMVLES